MEFRRVLNRYVNVKVTTKRKDTVKVEPMIAAILVIIIRKI